MSTIFGSQWSNHLLDRFNVLLFSYLEAAFHRWEAVHRPSVLECPVAVKSVNFVRSGVVCVLPVNALFLITSQELFMLLLVEIV